MSLPKILHVEVGGSFGGSLRALELYLLHADRQRFRHHLLLYFPTPGAERLQPLLDGFDCLEPSAPLAPAQRFIGRLLPRRRPTRGLEERIALAAHWPLIRRLQQYIEAGGYSLVHVNNSFWYQAPTLYAARRARVPLAAHVRNPVPATSLTRALAKIPDSVLVLHAQQAAELGERAVPGSLRVCPDGVTLGSVDPAAAARLRHQLGCGPDAVLIGSMGRLEPQKGYDLLLAAAAPLLRQRPDLHLVVFGEGSERAALTAAGAAQDFSDRIHLPGFHPDPATAASALDLFVSSSRWEGLPLAVLEALLAGLPVIATEAAVAGDPRLHRYLAAAPCATDAIALQSAIARVLPQLAAARQHASQGRDFVTAEFSPAASAARLDLALQAAQAKPLPGRAFYERVYDQPGWRPERSRGGMPGARFTKMWYRAFCEHILPRLALRGRTVLEVGAGYGYLLPMLRQRGARYVGVDIATSALRQLSEGSDGAVLPLLADACRLPVADASCDLAICMEVYEHIADPTALLSELRRVVRPGGRVVLSCPNYCNLYLPVKWLADAGFQPCRNYIKRQPLDPTLFVFAVRRRLEAYFEVLEQRAVRLHPPFFERFDRGGGRMARLNDWLFRWESRRGHQRPWRWLGLHSCFVLSPKPVATKAGVPPCATECNVLHMAEAGTVPPPATDHGRAIAV